MKKRQRAKRPLRFEALEARLTMSATAALHLPAAIPAQLPGVTPATLAELSSELAARSSPKAANPSAGTTPKISFNLDSPNWAGVEVDDAATNSQEGSAGDAAQAVQATWNVPTIVPSLMSYEVVGNWVGLGGGRLSLSPSQQVLSNLVQIGTYEDTDNGVSQYFAFWEVVGGPADTGGPKTICPMVINAGDQISGRSRRWAAMSTACKSPTRRSRSWPCCSALVYHYQLPRFRPVLHHGDRRNGRRVPAASVTSAEMITAEALGNVPNPIPNFGYVDAQAWVQTSPTTLVAFGGMPGYTVEDIASNDPSNTYFWNADVHRWLSDSGLRVRHDHFY